MTAQQAYTAKRNKTAVRLLRDVMFTVLLVFPYLLMI